MADERIEIEVVLDDGSIKKGFANIERQAKSSGQGVSKSFTASIAKLSGAFAGAAAAAVTVFGGRAAIRAAAAQEEAVNRFETALLTSGKAAEFSSQKFQEFASGLQEVTRFGDEATLEAAGLIQSLGQLSQEGLERSTVAAQDLASALGIDLQSAATLVGKAAAGDVGTFSRYGLSIKKAGTNAETLDRALTAIEKKFGGAASEQIKTYAGATEQAGNAFGDLLEEIGFFIVKNPVVISLINQTGKAFVDISKRISDFAKGGGIERLTSSLLSFGLAVNKFVVAPIELAVNVVNVAFASIRTTIQSSLTGLVELASGIVNKFAPSSKLAQALNGFADNSRAVLTDFTETGNEALNNLGDFSIAASVDNYIMDLQRALEANEKAGVAFVQQAAETSASANKSFEVTSQQINNVFNKGIAKGISAGIQALVRGEDGFKAFSSTILTVFGDFLIKLGESAILVGIGANAVEFAIKSLNGGVAIAAGIALIAAGAAFKSLSAGPSAAPQADNGGALVGTEPDIPTGEVTPVDPDELAGAQGQIIVNVDGGSVLDPRSVGLQIAEILKEVNDSNDLVTVNV